MKFENVRIDKLESNPFNPRKEFDPGADDEEEESSIADLAESIRKDGVLQPIVVRPAAGGYQIAAGERRTRACRKAGLKEIPATVRNLDDAQMRRYAIVENFHRLRLTGPELEEALGKIWERDYGGKKAAQGERDGGVRRMARDLGMTEPTVRRYLDAHSKRGTLRRATQSVSHQDLSEVGELTKESKDAAEVLLEARARGVQSKGEEGLTRDELRETAQIVRDAPEERRKIIAEEMVKAADQGKKLSKIHYGVAKDEAKEYAKTGGIQRLQIVIGHDERLLNRVADIWAAARRLDFTYLESFQTPFARERAITVLGEARDAISDTLERASKRQTVQRWKDEWDELREEKELPTKIDVKALPSVADLKRKAKGT